MSGWNWAPSVGPLNSPLPSHVSEFTLHTTISVYKMLLPHSCRTAFGKALLRERVELGSKRWAVRRKLASVRGGEPDWGGGGRERGVSGLTQVCADCTQVGCMLVYGWGVIRR